MSIGRDRFSAGWQGELVSAVQGDRLRMLAAMPDAMQWRTSLFASDDVLGAQLPKLERRTIMQLDWFLCGDLFAVQQCAVRLRAAPSTALG